MTVSPDAVTAYPKAARMRALKARMLSAASIVISEAESWDAPYQYAEALGLDDEDASKVCAEIADELWRRAVRITDPDLSEMVAAKVHAP